MATLYITEYATNTTPNTIAPVPSEIANTTQTVAIGGASAQSSALKNNTTMIRLHTDAICSVLFGTNPTATTSSRRMSANQTEYFTVPSNSSYKIAVISNT